MMDSQENALLQGAQVEKEVEQTTAQNAEAAADDQKVENAKVYKTKKEVVERLKEIAASDENPDKDEIDLLKTVFYKLHITEREARMKEYIDGGGDPEAYQIMPDEDEETFKQQMAIVREKRARIFQQQEAEKQANLEKKLEIIEKIKAMATSPDEANKSYNEFKELQQQWKDIKNVPADRASELWRNYQLYVEQFYDLLKLNSEAREYDFKKNLETKTKLCEAAEKLADEEDVISAFHQLQELHQQYRETGPVAKELREQIWTRFKAASTVINKRHQQHFEDLRSKEEENLTLKTALCEKVEEISKLENKTASDWEKRSKEIIDIQNQWKTIGFAPQKMNVKIFERFRAACDDFFGRKSEFFKEMKQAYAANIEKKKALVEKAQALADSTDWKVTSDKLINLQKEWKTIGVVPKKIGDQLEKKRSIIEQIKALVADAANATREKVQALTDEYNKVGHVPYKEKDALYAAYHEALDAIYKELNISNKRRRLDDFKSNIRNMAKRGEDAIDNERGRLTRRFEQLKQEIQTYENNLGFLNASSKKGNSLIDEMNRKVQKLRDDLELVRQKIKAIDTENK